MVTFAQAQERAEEWVNGELPAYQHREVRVREFGSGFVVWAEDRPEGPTSDGGRQRMVIARDSGEATLWPGLPVGEVIRRYEEEYGAPPGTGASSAAPPERVDLNQTSFLLSPPEWLQDAADKLGISDRRGARGGTGASTAGASTAGASTAGASTAGASTAGASTAGASATGVPVAGVPVADASAGPGQGSRSARSAQDTGGPRDTTGGGVTSGRGSHVGGAAWPGTAAASAAGAPGTHPEGVAAAAAPAAGGRGGGEHEPAAPAGATPWAGTDTNAGSDDGSVPLPATVLAPPLAGADDEDDQPPPAGAEAPTALMSGGSRLPRTAVSPAFDPQSQGAGAGAGAAGGGSGSGSGGPGAAPPPGTAAPRSAEDLADASTGRATVPPRGPRGTGPAAPPPPGRPPGVPGARPGAVPPESGGPGASGGPTGGYVPTQMVSRPGPGGPQPPDAPQPGPPRPPGPPGVPGTPPGGVHHAATVLANPGQAGPGGAPAGPGGAPAGPGVPRPPGPPGPVPYAPQPGPQTAYGYPQQPPQPPQPPRQQQQPAAVPTVGPGYQAVLRYRAPDGSEQQLIRRSAPGTPHPEWQIFHELRAMNVPSDQVLELHTELESCELPGGYCARMIRETWPQARITSIAPYGRDHAGRQGGMRQLLTHQGELHQVADGPARPAPVRAPLPRVQPAPPLPPEAVAHELVGSFGPQGVCRFEQRAVSRQGVPEIVARTLVWAGLPADFGPFFWAQPPHPVVPTLGELAAQRQVRPPSDANSYLVLGSDFGRAICVQYGTAHIVAVPVEGGPGGQPMVPQFVNSGLPEFTRSLALLGRMWRLRFGLSPEQAGRWTIDFQAQLATLDPAALSSPDSWWSVLLEQMWDGLL